MYACRTRMHLLLCHVTAWHIGHVGHKKHAGSEQRVPVTAVLHAFCVRGCCPASDKCAKRSYIDRAPSEIS